MAKQVYESIGIPYTATALASSTTTGKWLDIGDLESTISLILEAATSTSVTVLYEIGYTTKGKEGVPKHCNLNDATETSLTALTPNDSGAVSAQLTTANVSATNVYHGTLTPVPCRWIRFKLVNNDAGNAVTAFRLVVIFQR